MLTPRSQSSFRTVFPALRHGYNAQMEAALGIPVSEGLIRNPSLPCNRERRSRSGRAHRVQELADLELEPVAVARQRWGRGQHLRGGRSGLAGTALHVGDIGGHDRLGSVRELTNFPVVMIATT